MVSVNKTLQSISNEDKQAQAEAWVAHISKTRSEAAVGRLKLACDQAIGSWSRSVSEDQIATCLSHALSVATILDDLKMDDDTLVAAILHDAVHDSELKLEQIQKEFGIAVRELVEGVNRMDIIREYQENAQDSGHAQAEGLRKMLLAMVDDIRVVLIKMAIRLHSMRCLRDENAELQKSFAQETLSVFAPLANRLGIWQLKWELEDLSFRYINPDTYKKIASQLAEKRTDREAFLSTVVSQLGRALEANGIVVEVTSRPKHIYSIWKKMQRKSLDFHNIFDVRAVRILVNEVADCYAALGVVHGLWQHIPHEFDDYIANPKQNLYRSLHTAVVGEDGKPVEIQVRTHEMHQHSEFGVAAHWRYKEGTGHDAGFERKIAWLRELLEWKDEVADANEFVDRFKSETFEDRVYVFTPQGKIVDLAVGSTGVDFAYHIHTDLGHRCRGAKIDGKIVPLTYQLKTGDRVEVLSTREGGPSRDWLNPHLGYLKTSRARSKVRHWFKQQDAEQTIAHGRAHLDREIQRLGVGSVNHEKLAQHFNFNKPDDFFAAIGRGDVGSNQLAEGISAMLDRTDQPQLELPAIKRTKADAPHDAITIDGVGNLLTQMSVCCKPVPPDSIIGFITRGRGVTIHRQDCANILEMRDEEQERLIQVDWITDQKNVYPVDIQVVAYDRPGLLVDITGIMANEKVNVTAVNTRSNKEDNSANMSLTIEIVDLQQLSRVLSKIERLANVLEACRKR